MEEKHSRILNGDGDNHNLKIAAQLRDLAEELASTRRKINFTRIDWTTVRNLRDAEDPGDMSDAEMKAEAKR